MAGDWQVKGRVSFSTAVAQGERSEGEWYEGQFVPKMLASPKPTSYPQYLTQDGTAGKREHTTYFEEDRTTLRGHKLYWHRPTADPIALAREGDGRRHQDLLDEVRARQPGGRMHTLMAPVRTGVKFGAKVRFRNLNEVELGALLTALQLPAGCAHRLGMAKSLGLGSVRIEAQLKTVDPEAPVFA